MTSDKEAIENRFPHFMDLFIFENDEIAGINEEFIWNGYNVKSLKDYMMTISYCERGNISKYTDFNAFISRLHMAF